MPQINDAIDAAIANIAGDQNGIDDKLLRYYLANGAASLAVDDAEREFLVAHGEVAATTPDMWLHYLSVTKGFTGAFDDMELTYWGTGPRP